MKVSMKPAVLDRAPSSASASAIRVLLAEDHAITLWGLRQLIDSQPQRMQVCGTAATCEELMAHPELAATDVIVLDLGLGKSSALQCLLRLVGELGLKVIVLTGEGNPKLHRDAVLRGVRGVVLKSQPAQHILDAIDKVHRGEVWLDGSLMALVLGAVPNVARPAGAPGPSAERQRIATLTPKEREVVAAIVSHRGAKSLVIAAQLGLSEHTLRNHLTVIYSKLALRGRLELYVFATEHGLGGGTNRRGASDMVSSADYQGPDRRAPVAPPSQY